MNSGIVAVILGIIALLGAWFFGKSKGKEETKTEMSKEIATEKAKAEEAEFEKELAEFAAQETTGTVLNEAEISKKETSLIDELMVAKETGDEAGVFEIANKLAEIARSRRGQ